MKNIKIRKIIIISNKIYNILFLKNVIVLLDWKNNIPLDDIHD